MTPASNGQEYAIINADVIEGLQRFPDQMFHYVVTSPPYFGLRDYKTAKWEGGTDPACNHEPPDEAGNTDKPSAGQRQHAGRFAGSHCYRCGAKRIDLQIGMEKTPDEYVGKLVEVFREVKRVLRDDGTCFIVIGDSYAANRSYQVPSTKGGAKHSSAQAGQTGNIVPPGCKPKDLIGIPWMLAFALRADGWYLRSDIIWHKPNVMPSSVKDRPTTAHEYVFLLTKSAKYCYDYDSVKEPAVAGWNGSKFTDERDALTKPGLGKGPRHESTTRNRRSVWSINTRASKGAHFATFPPALVEPMILAGCPPDGYVLDPFCGSGTTLQVAVEQGRSAIGIELNPEYCKLAELRMAHLRA